MTFSWLLALVVLMATGSGRDRSSGKKKATKRSRNEDSTSSESEHSSEYEEESVQGKGKAPLASRKKKGADSPPRRSTGGPVIRERSQRRSNVDESEPHVSAKRRARFANRTCIGERHVNFNELCREVPDFARLLERSHIRPLGRVQPKMGFCVEIIREFYMQGNILQKDHDTGAFVFETTVRGVKFDITPAVIGANLGLAVDTTGLYYTDGNFLHDTHWDMVVDFICKLGTHTNRSYVESKDLKSEYHILSLIVCYNLLPTLGTKRIRWDRLLLLFFLGHPESANGINTNIPFLIWQQMVHVIEGSRQRDLLPYPILITRILEDHGVDISCAKYDYGLGAIDGITLAKSISTLKTFGHTKAYASEATVSAPPRQESPEPDEVITLQTLHRDVRSLKQKMEQRMEQGFKKLEDGLKKIFDILGCKHDDVVTGATAPSTSHGPTSHDDDDDSNEDE